MANENNKNNRRNKSGGEALTSGGFGCIFKPALKCKNQKERIEGVSKMSIEQHGKQEMDEIDKIKVKLDKIKNHQKYYLLNMELCYPDKLTEDDMIKFNEKCYALTRYNINEKNVNSRLDRLTILNMPYAGIDLQDWLIVDNKITREKMFLLNELIIKLIKFGIHPMNKTGVLHNDLKSRNILIDKNMNTRIIDWGLAGVVKDKKIPKEVMNRPLQFNTPFSSMLLSDEFKLNYDVFLQRVKDGIILFNKMNVRNYVINEYLIKLAKYYGYYDTNVILFNKLFSPSISEETFLSEVKRENLIEYGYYLYYLSNYITDILMKYTTSSMVFEIDKYFMECYLFNSDIFGVMTTYYNFYEIELKNIELKDDVKKIYLNRVRSVLVEHIFSNGGEKININKLCDAIKHLNKILNYDSKLKLPIFNLKNITLSTSKPSHKSSHKSSRKSSHKSSRKSSHKSSHKASRKSSHKSSRKSSRKF